VKFEIYYISCFLHIKNYLYIIKSKLFGQKSINTAYKIQMLKLVDSNPTVNI